VEALQAQHHDHQQPQGHHGSPEEPPPGRTQPGASRGDGMTPPGGQPAGRRGRGRWIKQHAAILAAGWSTGTAPIG
jgi:hypothetical protein